MLNPAETSACRVVLIYWLNQHDATTGTRSGLNIIHPLIIDVTPVACRRPAALYRRAWGRAGLRPCIPVRSTRVLLLYGAQIEVLSVEECVNDVAQCVCIMLCYTLLRSYILLLCTVWGWKHAVNIVCVLFVLQH